MSRNGSRGYVAARETREGSRPYVSGRQLTLERDVRDARERSHAAELENDLATEAVARFEARHELEYKVLLAAGERAALAALDAQWDVLEAARLETAELAREAAEEWHDAAEALRLELEARR